MKKREVDTMEKNMVEKLEKMVQTVCSQEGVALYDLELKRAAKGLIVLVYITKVNDVTIGDCQNVSRALSSLLEENDFIDERYFLEVSSPGLERELKLKKHYVSAIGEEIKITFQKEENSITMRGTLMEVSSDNLKLQTEDAEIEIPFSSIKKAKTYFEFKKKN